jgi:hypothetical protein
MFFERMVILVSFRIKKKCLISGFPSFHVILSEVTKQCDALGSKLRSADFLILNHSITPGVHASAESLPLIAQ